MDQNHMHVLQAMMVFLPILILILILIGSRIVIIPYWMIFKKAGFSCLSRHSHGRPAGEYCAALRPGIRPVEGDAAECPGVVGARVSAAGLSLQFKSAKCSGHSLKAGGQQ